MVCKQTGLYRGKRLDTVRPEAFGPRRLLMMSDTTKKTHHEVLTELNNGYVKSYNDGDVKFSNEYWQMTL